MFVWSDQCVIVCPLSLSLLLSVPPEAIGFLSAVGVFIVALAVLFLFINKKLYGEDDEDEGSSSSDSEEEVLSSLRSLSLGLRVFELLQQQTAANNNNNNNNKPSCQSAVDTNSADCRTRRKEARSRQTVKMEAKSQHQGFQDPLSAALEETERATTSSSLDKPSTVRESAARESLKLSMNRQAA
ncbi:hypothetical protein F7725_008691 [Dissostichus mawsoni]|uniref:Uncharacterized protein n=1 Tax=Dissostichus mawsoni TaxID=36200 RepID=A0A7J5YB17_DISMA|nr:hypothetical protein F7725_008691 [Dissostichus mawsoni]